MLICSPYTYSPCLCCVLYLLIVELSKIVDLFLVVLLLCLTTYFLQHTFHAVVYEEPPLQNIHSGTNASMFFE